MPLRNRVTPYGEIVAIPERGTLMGNRGVIHGDDGSHKREWQVRRWTELFFLDEATALAAGHRPCAECQREDYKRWQAAWPHGETGADAMDLVLHASRLDGKAKRTYDSALSDLPDGVIVERGGTPFLLAGGALRPWSAKGYGAAERARGEERVTVLTPEATVATIAGGYAVSLHPSAS